MAASRPAGAAPRWPCHDEMDRVTTSPREADGMAGALPSTAILVGPALRRGRMRRMLRDRTVVRLFITVWLVYSVHFASDIVRETYLAMSLAERFSIRVDDYLGLHPDLFAIEGRGAYINNNPGASLLGAIPYAVARPALEALYRLRPGLVAPKPAATYDDPRPNRNTFFNAARERGLDIRLGLAAAVMHAGLMVPLGAAAAVLVFLYLRGTLRDERTALWLALLYAFGTPIFFRTAFLNQNVLIAHAVLGAYILASHVARGDTSPDRVGRLPWIGLLLGFALLIDYSGIPLVLAFGVWLMAEGWRERGARGGLEWGLRYSAGVMVPVAVLLGYQALAFGNALLPAQSYMPETRFSVLGWNGFILPNAELAWRNLFDPRYGLLAFCPLLLLGIAGPFLKHRPGGPTRSELALIVGAAGALYLFLCSVAFAFLQWNTGVRYMVPAVPLLFMAAVPVLLRLPAWARYAAVVPTVCISWAVSMTRDGVPGAIARVFLQGFELPWLTVLQKTSAGYLPFLEGGASPLAIFVLLAVVLWLLWRGETRRTVVR
jgi:hypothetical protein